MYSRLKSELKELYQKHRLLGLHYSEIIDWAINQLEFEVPEDIMILAGLYEYEVDDINRCLRNILGDEMHMSDESLEETAGKVVVDFGKKYLNSNLHINEIEVLIDKLAIHLHFPNWMIVLSRNAEYDSDIDYYIKPFKDELKYIVTLWETYPEYNDFIQHYDRNESNKRM